MKVSDLFEGIKSGNLSNGYSAHWEVKDRVKKFESTHAFLMKTFDKEKLFKNSTAPNIMVKDFMDSMHGRHLGDSEKHTGLDSAEFKKEAISRFQAFSKKYRPEDYA